MRMTPAQLKRLLADAADSRVTQIDPPLAPSRVRTRKEADGPYWSRCNCSEEFTSLAAEDRHVAPGHNQFIVLERTNVHGNVIDYGPQFGEDDDG